MGCDPIEINLVFNVLTTSMIILGNYKTSVQPNLAHQKQLPPKLKVFHSPPPLNKWMRSGVPLVVCGDLSEAAHGISEYISQEMSTGRDSFLQNRTPYPSSLK